jgi:transposase
VKRSKAAALKAKADPSAENRKVLRAAVTDLAATRKALAKTRAAKAVNTPAGKSYREIQAELDCPSTYVARWKARFQENRLAGLDSRYAGRKAWAVAPRMEARVLAMTRKPPPDGSMHWSSRKMARELGISHVTVAKIWARAGLKPHRLRRPWKVPATSGRC